VLGPLFAYEALTAFFLEAAFLGVLLFGRTAERNCRGSRRITWGAYS
jgi:cytochrome bd-type quinol oxidase subunit 1